MSTNISLELEKLIQYGIEKGLIDELDKVYTKNRLLEVLQIDDIDEIALNNEQYNLDSILENILSYAVQRGLIEDSIVVKDIFDTKIMACLVGRPSEIINKFYRLYKKDPRRATDYYYGLSKNSNYIRWIRVQKDLKWKTDTSYGELDITINLSKPEKDPKAITMERKMKSSSYPKCLLCKENEGYAGRINHPARGNHRVIPLILNKEKWFFQYSPYVYYNEHCIIFKDTHSPMSISKDTFIRLLDFIHKFPHYFLGSNADLPIVGGSILSHDHFQGGNYEFPMAKSEIEEYFTIKGFEGITVGRINWPMTVVRLRGNSREKLTELCDHILKTWRNYSNEDVGVFAFSGDIPHNTITPIARRREGTFEMDLVLRNNRTSDEHPDGIFHPHKELHHIKKENIGLIEVMGLAVLPARLRSELKELEEYLVNKDRIDELDSKKHLIKHKPWINEILNKYEVIDEKNVSIIIQDEVALKFSNVLEHAGVFKRDEKGIEAFRGFIKSL